MTRSSTAFASLALLAALAAAPLAARAAEAGNVVGGGSATITGGGDDMRSPTGTAAPGGGTAVLRNPGGSPASRHRRRRPAGGVHWPRRPPTRREARLVGGGEDTRGGLQVAPRPSGPTGSRPGTALAGFASPTGTLESRSRRFVHIAASLARRAATGEASSAPPPTAAERVDAALPWFAWYDDRLALEGGSALAGLASSAPG
jgi:hypothetical protein